MLSCLTPPSASLQAGFAPPLHTPNLGVMVDGRHLHGQAVEVREVHTVRTAQTAWLESLADQTPQSLLLSMLTSSETRTVVQNSNQHKLVL